MFCAGWSKIWQTRFSLPNFAGRALPFLRVNERSRFKPKLEAGAWYAQLHSTALELASRGGEKNLAAAWLFETFAMHFLQDGTASGHIATPNFGGLSVIETKKKHDNFSQGGMDVSIANACNAIENEYKDFQPVFTQLVKACKSDDKTARIYGDRYLADKADSSPTKDLAIFLSMVSLQEFGNAIRTKKPLMPEQKNEQTFEEDPHWTFQGQANDELAEILFAWWESGGNANAETSPMSDAALIHIAAGNVKALSLWPKALR